MPGTRPSKTPLSVSTFSAASMLEDELVAQPAGRVAGAGLARAEDGELDAGHVQQLGDGLGDLLGPVLERAGAADPEQVLDLVGQRRRSTTPDLEVELLASSPRRLRAGTPHGLPLFSRLRSITPASDGKRRLDQHLVAAHVHDVVDVLDVDRALLDAGAAGGAGPEHVGVDDAALFGVPTSGRWYWASSVPVDPAEAGLRHAVLRRAGLERRRSPGDLVSGPPCRRSGTGPWRTGGPAGP